MCLLNVFSKIIPFVSFSGLCLASDGVAIDGVFSQYDDENFATNMMVNAPLPHITSKGETLRAAVGERVTLPCQVDNLGKHLLVAPPKTPVRYLPASSHLHMSFLNCYAFS